MLREGWDSRRRLIQGLRNIREIHKRFYSGWHGKRTDYCPSFEWNTMERWIDVDQLDDTTRDDFTIVKVKYIVAWKVRIVANTHANFTHVDVLNWNARFMSNIRPLRQMLLYDTCRTKGNATLILIG